AMRQGNTLSYLLSDGLGSTTIALSSIGSVTAVQLFAPYGSSRYSKGSMPTDYNFTGQRLDRETGLLYYGARYYDPLSGRFTQADLRQNNVVGMDPYAYVGENPESRTDPTGERFISPGGQQAPAGPISTDSPYATAPPTSVEQQAIIYQNLLNPGSASNGLPLLLNAFLFDHTSWVQAESYAQYQLHSSLLYLLGMQAWLLIHDSGINWNFNDLTRHLFLRLNGLAMAYAMASSGTSLDSAGMTDAQLLVSDSETTLAAETNPTEGCSFTAKTLVTTDQGKEPIGKLHVGEKVLAYNPKTHKMELQPILHVFLDKDNDLVDLTITTLNRKGQGHVLTGVSEIIHTNKKHPFLTQEKGFLPVGQIKLGMHVLRADGQWGVVTGWKVVAGTQVMYNLEVARDHTFTVGVGEWVVHNSCVVQDARSSNTFNDAMRQEVQPTLDRIEQGISDPHPTDGTPFANRDGDL
ncbi:MAG TPA: RHS repeat-associated core domain-containing protein, partial [Ktedonobacteraceae bacterium]|nr:RHS repeat-associated core domain-containing protein [Ktedonobacteraceae bacterium]